MSGWTDVAQKWFDNGWIAVKKKSETEFIIIDTKKLENCYFHFTRDLLPIIGPIGSNLQHDLNEKLFDDGTWIFSFKTYESLHPYSKEVIDVFKEKTRT